MILFLLIKTILFAIENAKGGEIFVPKIPSMKIVDLAKAIEPECKFKIIGIRPGEKLHETLISEDESRTTYDLGKYYAILPQFLFRKKNLQQYYSSYSKVKEGFIYRSDLNERWLDKEEIKKLIEKSLGVKL